MKIWLLLLQEFLSNLVFWQSSHLLSGDPSSPNWSACFAPQTFPLNLHWRYNSLWSLKYRFIPGSCCTMNILKINFYLLLYPFYYPCDSWKKCLLLTSKKCLGACKVTWIYAFVCLLIASPTTVLCQSIYWLQSCQYFKARVF